MKMKVFIILLTAFIVGIGLALLQGYGNLLKTQVSQPQPGRVAGIYSAACLADCQKDCAEDDLSCRQQCQNSCGE